MIVLMSNSSHIYKGMWTCGVMYRGVIVRDKNGVDMAKEARLFEKQVFHC